MHRPVLAHQSIGVAVQGSFEKLLKITARDHEKKVFGMRNLP
jgi:hypothetical protein